jgi:quinoprotein glucose dehydrogenase
MDRLFAGKLAQELQLELLTAAEQSGSAALQDKRNTFYASLPQDDPLRDYREAIAGGDAQRGQQIFFERAEVSCVRCHKVGGTGGEVGPDLTKVATEKQREYLLESIVDPNRQIAKGFNSVTLQLDDGRIVSGVLKSDDTTGVRLITPEGQTIVVPQDSIEGRAEGKSAMPEDVVKKLSKSDIRDLVEYLSTLR